jgi:hypothetical protein
MLHHARVRLDRALTPSQRLYVMSATRPDGAPPEAVTYVVMGSTGLQTYDIRRRDRKWTCTCPDYSNHEEQACKHIYYVVVNALHIPREQAIDFVRGMAVQAQPRWASSTVPPPAPLPVVPPPSPATATSSSSSSSSRPNVQRRGSAARAKVAPTTAIQPSQPTDKAPRPIERGQECGICYLEFEVSDRLRYCAVVCGQSVHDECFGRWLAHHAGNSSCVHCRTPMGSTAPQYVLVSLVEQQAAAAAADAGSERQEPSVQPKKRKRTAPKTSGGGGARKRKRKEAPSAPA